METVDFSRLFMLREAIASCRMEGIDVSLEEVLISMVREEEKQRRAARKRAKQALLATEAPKEGDHVG